MFADSMLLRGVDPFSLSFAGLLLGATVLLYSIYCIGLVIYNLYFHRLRDFPGPWTRTGLLFFGHVVVWKGDMVFDAKRLHDEYGDVVRITPEALSFRTSQAMKDIYGAKPGPGRIWKDPKFYKFSSSNDIINANDADHARMRRLMAHAFSDSALAQQEPIMNQYFTLLTQRLHEQIADPATDGVVDLTRWYNFATFDLAGDLSFGEPFDALRRGDYHRWIARIFQAIKLGGRIGRIARAWPLLGLLVKALVVCVPGVGRAMKEHRAFARERVERRLEAKTDRKDIMSYILRHNDERGMTRDEIVNNASILIIAGSETTATLLCGATYYLCANPDALARARAEVRGAFAAAEAMTLAALARLPYLQAVIEEALRMYPPVPGMLPRRTGARGNVIDGHFVPGHTVVSFNHYAAYHSGSNFASPETFAPDRWLDPPPAAYRNDDRAALKPFSFGPRNCLGQHLAYSEMRAVLARMLWHFDWELQADSARWAPHKVHVLWEKPPLRVKLSPRRDGTKAA